MKIVNKSEHKVIFVNNNMLLPDDSMIVDESAINPAVKVLIDTGLLAVDSSDDKKAESVSAKPAETVAPSVDEAANTVAAETEAAPVARRGRRAKNVEETPNE